MNTSTLSASIEATTLTAELPAPAGNFSLREWLGSRSMDRRSRYLAAAADHADLERRMRAWDEHQEASLRSLNLP